MGNLPLTFLPPQNWQDFEKLLRGVVEVIWEQQGWHNYGRPGQKQSGIDLFGYDNRGKFTAIQCKKKEATDDEGQLLTISLITETLIDKEIKRASGIKDPQLDRLIFATTSPTDRAVQNLILKKNEERKKQSLFELDMWFWQDIQVHIERHKELMYWYYQDFLENIHQYDKNVHFLLMLRRAFTRPAFQRMIQREESGGDFIQAIRDTQEAITTGKLYNRRGMLVTTSYDYAILKKKWKASVWKIYSKLEEIRNIYQDGVRAGAIVEHPACIDIQDAAISQLLNKLRAEGLQILNTVLQEAGLDPISAELTRPSAGNT